MADRVVPVQNFGLMMAVGALSVFFATVGIVPACVLWGRCSSNPKRRVAECTLNEVLSNILLVDGDSHGHSPWQTQFCLCLQPGAIFRIQFMSGFSDNFQQNSRIVRSDEFLTIHMGADDSFHVLVNAPSESTPEYYHSIRQLQQEIENIPAVTRSMSRRIWHDADSGRVRQAIAV